MSIIEFDLFTYQAERNLKHIKVLTQLLLISKFTFLKTNTFSTEYGEV